MIPNGSTIAHADKWVHPAWCDPRICAMDSAGTNVEHAQIAARWLASESDMAVTVSLAKADEIFRGKQLLESPPAVAVRFESIHDDDYAADAHLGAEDCRQLALVLLEMADKLDDATPTAAIPKQQNRVKLAAAPDGGDAA